MKTKTPGLLKKGFILFFVFCLFGVAGAETKTNVLFICMDALRRDALGCYGCEGCATPHIDRLARRGVLFENAVSVAPWTLPSVFSMFTGSYPSKHRMNIAYRGEDLYVRTKPLDSGIQTLGEMFKEKGYRCAAFTGGRVLKGAFGYERGFDTYDVDCWDIAKGVEKTIDWLSLHQKESFFVFLHTYSAHFPYKADPRYRRAGADGRARKVLESCNDPGNPEACRNGSLNISREEIDAVRALYEERVSDADREIGRLMAYLKKRGLLENTLIVLVADHGEEFYEHGAFFHGQTLYREQLDIPLILVPPAASEKGRRCPALVSNIDIFATLCDVLGEESSSDGVSLLRTLAGEEARESVFSEATQGVDLKSLTTDRYKLILNTKPGSYGFAWKENAKEWQFYDLLADPLEKDNRASKGGVEFERLKERMRKVLESHASSRSATTAPEAPAVRFEDSELEELRSLGYLH